MIPTRSVISTIEEVNNIDQSISGYYYRPKIYLSKYLFTKEILLDVFCCNYLVSTFEDDYYNDLNIDMIVKYQPHIDKREFLTLWKDLDEILVVEQFCKFIINYPNYVVRHFYNSISEYINYHGDINKFIELILHILRKNKYINKYDLQDKIEYIGEINKYNEIEEIKKIAQDILSAIPSSYSSIIPL